MSSYIKRSKTRSNKRSVVAAEQFETRILLSATSTTAVESGDNNSPAALDQTPDESCVGVASCLSSMQDGPADDGLVADDGGGPAPDGRVAFSDQTFTTSEAKVTTFGSFNSVLVTDSWPSFDGEGNQTSPAILRDQTTDIPYFAPDQILVVASQGNLTDTLNGLGYFDFKTVDDQTAVIPVDISDGLDAFRILNDLSGSPELSTTITLRELSPDHTLTQLDSSTTASTVIEAQYAIMPYFRSFGGVIDISGDVQDDGEVENTTDTSPVDASSVATVGISGNINASLVTDRWPEYDDAGNQISQATLRDLLTDETYLAPEQISVTSVGTNLSDILAELGITEFKSIDDHTAIIPVSIADGDVAPSDNPDALNNPKQVDDKSVDNIFDDGTLDDDSGPVDDTGLGDLSILESGVPEIRFFSMAPGLGSAVGGPEVQRSNATPQLEISDANSQAATLALAPVAIVTAQSVSATNVQQVALPVKTVPGSTNFVPSGGRTSLFGNSSQSGSAGVQGIAIVARGDVSSSELTPSLRRKRTSTSDAGSNVHKGDENSTIDSLDSILNSDGALSLPLDSLNSNNNASDSVNDTADTGRGVMEDPVIETSETAAHVSMRARNIDEFMADFAANSFTA